jgi:hypothetical protein
MHFSDLWALLSIRRYLGAIPLPVCGLFLASLVAVITLGALVASDVEEPAPSPTGLDTVSSLSHEEWVLPTNAHPYPEALAVGVQPAWHGAPGVFGNLSFQGVGSDFVGALMPGAVVSGLMLSAEQLQVARFFADKYRLPLDQVAEAVANAYFTAREMRVDPLLVVAVISIESGFNARARSQKGAEGLMQVMTSVHEEKFMPFGGVATAYDPVVNIQVGVGILRDHLLREGSIEGALKAYVGAARRPHDGGYGRRVMREREAIQQALAVPIEARSSVAGLAQQVVEHLF